MARCKLIGLLPGFIRITPSHFSDADWISSTLQLMALEAEALRLGGEGVIVRLSDLVVIQRFDRGSITTRQHKRAG